MLYQQIQSPPCLNSVRFLALHILSPNKTKNKGSWAKHMLPIHSLFYMINVNNLNVWDNELEILGNILNPSLVEVALRFINFRRLTRWRSSCLCSFLCSFFSLFFLIFFNRWLKRLQSSHLHSMHLSSNFFFFFFCLIKFIANH